MAERNVAEGGGIADWETGIGTLSVYVGNLHVRRAG